MLCQLKAGHGERTSIVCVEAGDVLQGAEQLVLLLLAHVEGGTTVKVAADHHAGDRGLNGCAAVPTEAPLAVPVLPGGSFQSPVLCVEKARIAELIPEGTGRETDHQCPCPVSTSQMFTYTSGRN